MPEEFHSRCKHECKYESLTYKLREAEKKNRELTHVIGTMKAQFKADVRQMVKEEMK